MPECPTSAADAFETGAGRGEAGVESEGAWVGGGEVPRDVVKRAAELAAFHSKAKAATGKVGVHVCRACDVRKPRGAKPGSVELRRFDEVKVYPRGAEGGA